MVEKNNLPCIIIIIKKENVKVGGVLKSDGAIFPTKTE